MQKTDTKLFLIQPVWNMEERKYVELRPWMRWCPYILTPILSDDEWMIVIKRSITKEELEFRLKQENKENDTKSIQ
jgi:hypothetical protein